VYEKKLTDHPVKEVVVMGRYSFPHIPRKTDDFSSCA